MRSVIAKAAAALLISGCALTAPAQNAFSAEPDSSGKRLWIGSMVAVFAASGFDAGTSWGKFESNPLLASPNGRFGAKGLSIKLGIGAALVAPQLLFHKHKQVRTEFTITNLATAGVFTGVAVHNLGIAPPKNP